MVNRIKKMKKIIYIALFILALAVPTTLVIKSIQFTQHCEGYLKQAADASTPELALERLNYAIAYIENHGLTEGYTSILYKTEDENVGFWYKNLLECRNELQNCLNKSQLEKTNVLMKTREALTDTGETGTKLTIPTGIYKFPHNFWWATGLFLSLSYIIGCIFVGLLWLKEL